MPIATEKYYCMVCDDETCKCASDNYPSKAELLITIKEKGWVKRGTNFYCKDCALKYPGLKRGRKPKPKPKPDILPADPVWKAESEVWSPEAE